VFQGRAGAEQDLVGVSDEKVISPVFTSNATSIFLMLAIWMWSWDIVPSILSNINLTNSGHRTISLKSWIRSRSYQNDY
jgi:hypothetical protein